MDYLYISLDLSLACHQLRTRGVMHEIILEAQSNLPMLIGPIPPSSFLDTHWRCTTCCSLPCDTSHVPLLGNLLWAWHTPVISSRR